MSQMIKIKGRNQINSLRVKEMIRKKNQKMIEGDLRVKVLKSRIQRKGRVRRK